MKMRKTAGQAVAEYGIAILLVSLSAIALLVTAVQMPQRSLGTVTDTINSKGR